MAEVTLTIGGHHYAVSCRDGEEDHLGAIGSLVNAKTREAKAAVGDGLGEARQLLFAALLLADEVNELRQSRVSPEELERIEGISIRIAALARGIA